jgi:cellulose synthase/poly-beta-1,6-N-acetylglucosamine synthase-like glycosyltransferase
MAQVLDFSLSKAFPRLGELLRRDEAVTEAGIAAALERQLRQGGRLGELLVMEGSLNWPQLVAALAKQQNLASVDLFAEPCDTSLLYAASLGSYQAHGWVPWRQQNGVLYVAAQEVTPALMAEVRRHTDPGQPLAFLLTSPRDLRYALASRFVNHLDWQARQDLFERYPLWSSCRRPVDRWMLAGLLGFLTLMTIAPLSGHFVETVLVFANLLFLASILFKWRLVEKGRHVPWPRADAASVPDEALPVYTVLLPLYREAASVPGILSAMAGIDYPKHKLDVKLIIESDDEETLHATYAAKPPAYVDILCVPASQPRTKPKACNYALAFARGEYVTIYDAEDVPAPDQLRRAVALFTAYPSDVVCLQARLNYYNYAENWLTRCFAMEYALLFDRMIPALHAWGIPIPLGGTSNHIALRRLRELGAWDPYNVTEDADLGLRFAAAGLRTLPLDSLTLEEAPLTIPAWLKQRSRWIKGYLSTWIVHMRAPERLIRHGGFWPWLGLQFLIGGASLVYLIAPILWVVCLLGWAMPARLPPVPDWVSLGCWSMLGLGWASQWQMAWQLTRDRGWRGMGWATLGFPAYWMLHSLASFRALWQLLVAPSHWDKTQHGVTAVKNREIPPEAA